MRNRRKSVPSQNLAPVILIAAGAVLILAVLIWQLVQSQSRPTTGTAVRPGGPTLTTAQIPRVSPAEALAAQQSQQAVIVDVRDAGSYAAGHISGAINIPLGELEQRAGELNAGQEIIFYCT
jgi:3-mercaptopyruvate sulfurtransferase SseA